MSDILFLLSLQFHIFNFIVLQFSFHFFFFLKTNCISNVFSMMLLILFKIQLHFYTSFFLMHLSSCKILARLFICGSLMDNGVIFLSYFYPIENLTSVFHSCHSQNLHILLFYRCLHYLCLLDVWKNEIFNFITTDFLLYQLTKKII